MSKIANRLGLSVRAVVEPLEDRRLMARVTGIGQVNHDQQIAVQFDTAVEQDLPASAFTVVDLKQEAALQPETANPTSPFVPLQAPAYADGGRQATLRPDLVDASNPKGLLPNGWYEASVRHGSVVDDGTNVATFRYLNADFDGSGTVNYSDFLILQGHFLQTNATFADGDADHNGTVNFSDYLILQGNFLLTLPDLPTVPGQVAVSNATPGRLSVSWAAADGEARDGFKVYRSSDGYSFELVDGAVDKDARVWEDPSTDLIAGMKYWYRVRSYTTANGASASVSKASAVVIHPVTTPGDFTATGVGPGRIALSWDLSPDTLIGSVNVYRGLTPGFTPSAATLVAGVDDGATSYVDTGLVADATYYYTVVAVVAGGGSSAPALPVSATAKDEKGPAAPLLSVGQDAAHPDWASLTYSTPDGAHLELEVKGPDDDNFAVGSMVLDSSPGSHTAAVAGLKAGKTYSFRLRADKNARIKYSPVQRFEAPNPLSLLKPTITVAEFGTLPQSPIVKQTSSYTSGYGHIEFTNSYPLGPNSGTSITLAATSSDPYGVALSTTLPINADTSNVNDPAHIVTLIRYGETTPYAIKNVVTAVQMSGPNVIHKDVSESESFTMVPCDYTPAAPVLDISGSPDASGNYTIHYTTESEETFTEHDITEIRVYRAYGNIVERIHDWSLMGGVKQGSVTSHADADTRFFAIALNASGDQSFYSNVVSPDGETATPPPAAPAALQYATEFADAPTDKPSENEVHLIWDNVPNDETGFEVERSDDDGLTYKAIDSTDADETELTDKGMLPGTYVYRVRSTGEDADSAWTTISVGVWPPGLMVGFDGTWSVPKSHTNVSHMADKYNNGSIPRYQKGVGGIDDNPEFGDLWQGAFATESMSRVIGVYAGITEFYQSPEARKHIPLDVIGYSRGCFQAVMLANLVADKGVPDTASARTKTDTIWVPNSGGQTPPNGWHRETRTYTVYDHWFTDVKVRSLVMVSPVGMNGGDAALTGLSLGLIPNLNLGWDTTASGKIAHVLQLRDNAPNHPFFNETPIDYAGNPDNYETHTFPEYSHSEIGQWTNTWAYIKDWQRKNNVPVA